MRNKKNILFFIFSAESTRLMVGYGPHTVVPHLFSPLFRVMADYINDIEVIFSFFLNK